MAIAFVKCTELRSTSSSASATVSATTGNALIAVCAGFGADPGALTMSGGGTWVTDYVGTLVSPQIVGFTSCASATGGSLTITGTYATGGGITVFIMEFSGMATSSMFEGHGTTNNGTSTTPTTNALTNTQADALKFAGCSLDSGSNTAFSSTGTGWTLPANGSEPDGTAWLNGASGYKIVSASQSDTEAWSRTGSNPWVSDITTYLAPAAAGLPPGLGPSMEMDPASQSAQASMMR